MDNLAEQWPAIAAVIFVVGLFLRAFQTFLKYIKDENKRREQTEIHRIEQLEKIGDACHEHTKELNERACSAIDKSTVVIQETLKSLGSISETMKGCAKRANGKT